MDNEKMKRQLLFGTGYASPPKENQFKKGQSGNPKGRPKKTSSDVSLSDQPTLSAILSTALRMVQVRDEGGPTEINMRDALARAAFAGAVKGNARSQALVFDLLRKGDEARAREIRGSNEFWRDYKNRVSAEIEAARNQGISSPTPLPHPDDIVIDHENGPQFLGPIDEAEQKMVQDTLRCRDVLIMQDALDRRSDVIDYDEIGSAELLAMVLERGVPARLRLSQTEWVHRAMKYESMPKRVLLKLLHESWTRIGRPLPRGFVFPELSWMTERIGMIVGLLNSIRSLQLDPSNAKEWEATVASMVLENSQAD